MFKNKYREKICMLSNLPVFYLKNYISALGACLDATCQAGEQQGSNSDPKGSANHVPGSTCLCLSRFPGSQSKHASKLLAKYLFLY
jgi:hypothetical protein